MASKETSVQILYGTSENPREYWGSIDNVPRGEMDEVVRSILGSLATRFGIALDIFPEVRSVTIFHSNGVHEHYDMQDRIYFKLRD